MQTPYTLKNKAGINGLGAGVWNLGPGSDPFGGPTRETIPILERLPLLAAAGMTFYEAHDHEIPASEAERAKRRADETGLKCAMYTPSFAADPLCKDGGMTANDATVRQQAAENSRRAVDTTVQLGANMMVFWNGREG